MAGKKILLIGGGGREYALGWKLRQSPACGEIFCAPGNGGMTAWGELLAIAAEDGAGLVRFARQQGIDLAVIGPETALAAGVSDRLRAAGVAVFGPSKAATKIESSKLFARRLAAKARIPGPAFFPCADVEEARVIIHANPKARIIKQDGLAAGKGVHIATNADDAQRAAMAWLKHGAILVEEQMAGVEASFFALAAGRKAVAFGSAQDYKRAFDGDEGPNTGGMGAVSPSPLIDGAMETHLMDRFIRPALAALADDGTPFYGVLYAGLMLTDDGMKLVEFNARFGDPECQLLMLRLKSDLLPALLAVAQGRLPDTPQWRDEKAIGVVLASKGYPGDYQSGQRIEGLNRPLPEKSICFHAATKKDKHDYYASGGRVLMAAALGADYHAAGERVYKAAQQLRWPNSFYRRDIGANVFEMGETP